MSSILESLSSTLDPDSLAKISKLVGTNTDSVTKGVAAIGPLVMTALARRATQPGTGAGFLDLLPKETGGMTGNLLGALTGGLTGGHAKLVSSLLGAGTGAIGGALSKRLGFDARPVLALITPLVGAFVGKMAREKSLDAPAVAKALTTESNAFLDDPKNAEIAGIAKEALRAGEEAERLRGRFTETEWTNVRLAPMAAMFAVAGASPSGPVGIMKEGNAAAKVLKERLSAAPPTSLLSTLFGDGQFTDEIQEIGKNAPTKDKAMSIITEAIAVVNEKSPADATVYRDVVMELAQKAAEASKEGGFLGIGGVQVSKDEQQVLDQLRTALH